MKKIFLITIIFLSCCSTNKDRDELIKNFEFDKNMNFKEISLKLKQYTKNSMYPSLDE